MIEDDAPLRELNRLLLERTRRFQVVGNAENGLQAIDLARKLEPDVILLDLVMPLMGGTDALPLLRKACPRARIIVLSMLQRERMEEEVLRLGADAFMDKGLDSKEFVERLTKLVEEADARPSHRNGTRGRSFSDDAEL